MTSETNPESGTTSYTFDLDSTCGTSEGDLVKSVDAVGNVTCYSYDGLHRTTSATYSGPYSSATPGRYLVYDSATVDSVVMTNAKAHLAEAYTCVSPCSSKLTDEGFSYTARGETSDVYESTPHFGGYYHLTETYWANGALDQLSGLSGLPTITYGVDGEGRTYTASASSGQNPLSSTSYSPASLPTQVTLGSSDSDSYAYDPNTNRMTEYKFTVNSQSVTGNLTWNANGSLASLLVTDPFNSSDTQSCSFSHDDLARIASANCGSTWSQTFSYYDAFGNIEKTGSSSFQATYSYLTNRMTQIGSSNPTYDANGNVTNDFLNSYSWDANGRPVTIDSVNVTYDALGRMVEENKSGTYTEIVYDPLGNKLALMTGQSLSKAYVPLSAGDVAAYNASGLSNYDHVDWLGSFRLASSSTRTVVFDTAYGPFGETYATTGSGVAAFTGQRQDTSSNVYDFPAREYGIQGRWPSPDPAGIASVDPTDPQTWNRYAYVHNSPLTMVDPTGLDGLDYYQYLQEMSSELLNGGLYSPWQGTTGLTTLDLANFAYTPVQVVDHWDVNCAMGSCNEVAVYGDAYPNMNALDLVGVPIPQPPQVPPIGPQLVNQQYAQYKSCAKAADQQFQQEQQWANDMASKADGLSNPQDPFLGGADPSDTEPGSRPPTAPVDTGPWIYITYQWFPRHKYYNKIDACGSKYPLATLHN